MNNIDASLPEGEDPRTIKVDQFLSHPPARVWAALTEPDLLAKWFMPCDFELRVGHRFTFRAEPIPNVGFSGVGQGEVLEFEPEKLLRYTWADADADAEHGSSLDSTVTWRLEPEGTGTRLFLEHDGFDPDDPRQLLSRTIMGKGWPGVVRSLSQSLERV